MKKANAATAALIIVSFGSSMILNPKEAVDNLHTHEELKAEIMGSPATIVATVTAMPRMFIDDMHLRTILLKPLKSK
jgi:hypothetical protein